MRKKHKIASKPYFGAFLFCILGFVLPSLFSDKLDSIIENAIGVGYVGSCILAIVFLFLFKLWFRPEFKGCIHGEGWNVRFMIPFVVVLGIDLIMNGISFSNLSTNTIMMSITAGLFEETAFRVYPVSVFLRGKRKESDIMKGVIFISAIFGVFHLGNMLGGAGLGVSILQVCATFASGMLFAALYIRTGSIIPSMILHGLHDFVCFLDPAAVNESGIVIADLTTDLVVNESVMFAANLAMAIFILRPSVRKDIVAIWDKKWGGDN